MGFLQRHKTLVCTILVSISLLLILLVETGHDFLGKKAPYYFWIASISSSLLSSLLLSEVVILELLKNSLDASERPGADAAAEQLPSNDSHKEFTSPGSDRGLPNSETRISYSIAVTCDNVLWEICKYALYGTKGSHRDNSSQTSGANAQSSTPQLNGSIEPGQNNAGRNDSINTPDSRLNRTKSVDVSEKVSPGKTSSNKCSISGCVSDANTILSGASIISQLQKSPSSERLTNYQADEVCKSKFVPEVKICSSPGFNEYDKTPEGSPTETMQKRHRSAKTKSSTEHLVTAETSAAAEVDLPVFVFGSNETDGLRHSANKGNGEFEFSRGMSEHLSGNHIRVASPVGQDFGDSSRMAQATEGSQHESQSDIQRPISLLAFQEVKTGPKTNFTLVFGPPAQSEVQDSSMHVLKGKPGLSTCNSEPALSTLSNGQIHQVKWPKQKLRPSGQHGAIPKASYDELYVLEEPDYMKPRREQKLSTPVQHGAILKYSSDEQYVLEEPDCMKPRREQHKLSTIVQHGAIPKASYDEPYVPEEPDYMKPRREKLSTTVQHGAILKYSSDEQYVLEESYSTIPRSQHKSTVDRVEKTSNLPKHKLSTTVQHGAILKDSFDEQFKRDFTSVEQAGKLSQTKGRSKRRRRRRKRASSSDERLALLLDHPHEETAPELEQKLRSSSS